MLSDNNLVSIMYIYPFGGIDGFDAAKRIIHFALWIVVRKQIADAGFTRGSVGHFDIVKSHPVIFLLTAGTYTGVDALKQRCG